MIINEKEECRSSQMERGIHRTWPYRNQHCFGV